MKRRYRKVTVLNWLILTVSSGIKAKALVLPSQTDLYFPPEDSELEVQAMRSGTGELKVIPSIWGHWAGGPGDSKEDVKWLDTTLRDFFSRA